MIVAPIIWQNLRLITSRRPVPPYRLAVAEDAWENSWYRRPICSSVMPMPVSATASVIQSRPFPARCHEAGAFDDEFRAADLLQEYEGKIAALERMVGRQALEIEFLKGALRSAPRTRSATTSVITGPVGFPSPKDAD